MGFSLLKWKFFNFFIKDVLFVCFNNNNFYELNLNGIVKFVDCREEY